MHIENWVQQKKKQELRKGTETMRQHNGRFDFDQQSDELFFTKRIELQFELPAKDMLQY